MRAIRLTENRLRSLIRSVINEEVNEMGTPKQNSFLRRLMGDRYKDEYDDLSVSDSSRMIDRELQAQREQGNSSMATEKQVNFIANNKYYPIPDIMSVKDKLTKADAGDIISALNPYQGRATYYGNIRTKKEIWLPNMLEVVGPLLKKYGLDNAASEMESYVNSFTERNNALKARKEQKEMATKMEQLQNNPNTIVFVSTQDEENYEAHKTEMVRNVWMDGKLEDAMGWDIAYVVTDMGAGSLDSVKKYVLGNNYLRYPTSFDAIVLGYDKPCSLVVWPGTHFPSGGGLELCGRLVDASERGAASKIGEGLMYKPDSGAHI